MTTAHVCELHGPKIHLGPGLRLSWGDWGASHGDCARGVWAGLRNSWEDGEAPEGWQHGESGPGDDGGSVRLPNPGVARQGALGRGAQPLSTHTWQAAARGGEGIPQLLSPLIRQAPSSVFLVDPDQKPDGQAHRGQLPESSTGNTQRT